MADSQPMLKTLPMSAATQMFIFAAAWYYLTFVLSVLRPVDWVRSILLLRMILVLLICFRITILKIFPLLKCTSENFFVWLNSFSASHILPGTLGRLSLRKEELFIHSRILGHSFPWKPTRPKRLLCKA